MRLGTWAVNGDYPPARGGDADTWGCRELRESGALSPQRAVGRVQRRLRGSVGEDSSAAVLETVTRWNKRQDGPRQPTH